MKIALISGFPDGAIDQVMQPLCKGLRAKGVECDVFDTYKVTSNKAADMSFDDYDLVHFGYYNYGFAYRGHIAKPMTANIWHIPITKAVEYSEALINTGFERVVVDDTATLQALGQTGIMHVTPIELFFDYDKFYTLPKPEGEFTVGVFCNNYQYKRWEVVVEACEELDIMCHPVIAQKERRTYDINPIEDVYSHCHVMVHATFVDTNSLPIREALLCGRPSIVTHSDGLNRIIKEGVNGLYFDGSKGDLKRAILRAKRDYDTLRQGAINTKLPDPVGIVDNYIDMFEKVLDEIEID